jgi:serine/threonine protein kinase
MPSDPSSKDFGPSTQQFDASSAREALPTGTRLGGYQIIDVLGRGAFSIVYLALDSSLQRQVAIKEYLPADLATRRGGQRPAIKPNAEAAYASGLVAFLEEAKLLARFDHSSLARVHSFWEENGTAYTVMPYYDGHTLARVLQSQPRPPDEAWLRALLTPLLSALSVLHAAQCYHRNISPDNIVLLADGRPVLLGFGAANLVVGDKPQPLAALVDAAYAPIEQSSTAARLPQGPWTDLYALAGVLHFAITGQPPELATARLGIDPQRPLADSVRALSPQFPGLRYSEAFLAGIDKALSVKPRDRPGTVADFQQWLDRAVPPSPAALAAAPVVPPEMVAALQVAAASPRNEPVFTPPPPRDEWFAADPLSRATPPRRRGALWVMALGAVALAAGGAWWWTQHRLPAATPLVAAPVAASAPAPDPAPAAASAPVEVAAASAVAPSASEAAPAASVAAAAGVAAASEPAFTAPAASAVAPAEPAASAPAVTAAEPEPEAKPAKKPAKPVAVAEPDTPRAACGSRANFSLFYCMQTQCKKPRFAQHPQCTELQRRGEVN